MAWIKLDCPRCKATSSVGVGLAGQYTICPACQARVLVPINAPATEVPPGAAPSPVQSSVGAQPQSAAQSAPATVGPPGAPNLRKTVQASATQTWVGGQPLPSAPGLGNGPPPGPPQAIRPVGQPLPPGPGMPAVARPPQQVGPVTQANPGPGGPPYSASPASLGLPPLADVPLLPQRANTPPPAPQIAAPPPAPQITAPPAAPSPYPIQPVRPGFTGGPPPVGSGAMIPKAVPGLPAAPPVPTGVALPAAGGIAPAGARKVARFIAAEPAQSTIQLAADGQLPSLQLIEAGKTVAETTKGSSMNPLLVLGAIAASFCVSIMLLVAPAGSSGQKEEIERVLQELRTDYEGNRGPLLPYQLHLREAQQAYSRRAFKTARDHYRKVLDMLHAEGGDRFHGLTGTPTRDKKLEDLLTTLLNQDFSTSVEIEEP